MDRMSAFPSLRRLLFPLICLSLISFGGLLSTGSLLAQDPASAPAAPSADGSTQPPVAPPPAEAAPVPDAVAPAAVPAPAPAPDAPPVDETVARAVAVPKPTKFPLPTRDPAIPDADYIGHRFAEPNDSGGWGWVKLPTDSWSKGGRWIALEETPGVASAPWRDLGPTPTRTADQNYEYKMHGYFAPYQVYDPHTNEMLDVFVLESYETIGPAQPLKIRSGPEDRMNANRSSLNTKHRDEDAY